MKENELNTLMKKLTTWVKDSGRTIYKAGDKKL